MDRGSMITIQRVSKKMLINGEDRCGEAIQGGKTKRREFVSAKNLRSGDHWVKNNKSSSLSMHIADACQRAKVRRPPLPPRQKQ